jgi:hypothetical protein
VPVVFTGYQLTNRQRRRCDHMLVLRRRQVQFGAASVCMFAVPRRSVHLDVGRDGVFVVFGWKLLWCFRQYRVCSVSVRQVFVVVELARCRRVHELSVWILRSHTWIIELSVVRVGHCAAAVWSVCVQCVSVGLCDWRLWSGCVCDVWHRLLCQRQWFDWMLLVQARLHFGAVCR